MDSILDSVKQTLGLTPDYDVFDVNILMYINTAFSSLTQLGIGPEEGFAIVDESSTWDSFLEGNKRLNMVQTYVYLRVRLLFDPPGTSYLLEALEKQSLELEWRLNVVREGKEWQDPTTVGS